MKVTLVRSRAIDPAINKVAKALADNGYDVKLLVWDRMGNRQTEDINGYTVCRFSFKAPHDETTVVFYLPIWWLYEFFFLLKQKSTVIHVCDLDTLIPAIFVKLIKKVKLCYTIYDFYADNLPNKFPHIFKKFVANVERFGIRFTEALFLVDECRYEQVKGAKINNIEYIYNSPPDYSNQKQKHNSNTGEELRIFYAGIIHKSRGLEYVIEAIRDLNDIKLTIAGAGPDTDFLKHLPTDIKKNIRYIGPISYEKVMEKTMESDILFAFYDPIIPNNRYASPNKLFESMMCGKPIIINSETTASKIVITEKCGLVVPYGDVDAIRGAILRLKNNPVLRKELGENGRNAYIKKYGWNIMKDRIIEIYNKIDNSDICRKTVGGI